MNRPDLPWASGPSVREQVWGWRHEITSQVVNPDIDGLLTACLMHHLKGWKVIGFYDVQRIMLDPSVPVPLKLDEIAWVDIDMCWPGARSLSQHVVSDHVSDRDRVSAYGETVNPSLLRGHARTQNYTTKYPFGTFQWAWWLAGAENLPALPDPDDEIVTGLAWMPDGGFGSVQGVWTKNCLQWAIEQLPGSILSPLASSDPDAAKSKVIAAEAELIRISGVERGWRNHQFNLTHSSGTGPILNFPIDEVPEVLQAVCDAICTIYGWDKLQLPTALDVHEGIWRTGAAPPHDWPNCADRREVVSLAVTSKSQFCWTEPGGLTALLC